MTHYRWGNAAHSSIEVFEEGEPATQWIFPNPGNADYAQLLDEEVEIEEAVTPQPVQVLLPHYGYARFGWASGTGLVIKELSQNIGGVTRLSAGRYRISDVDPNGIELVLRDITPRDASTTPIHAHATVGTTNYVELRCFKWNGTTFAAVDPAEVFIEIDKVVMQ